MLSKENIHPPPPIFIEQICIALIIFLSFGNLQMCLKGPLTLALLPPAGSCAGCCPLMNVDIDSHLYFMNQRQFPLQAPFQAWRLKTRRQVDKQQVESQTVLIHQMAVWETWFETELHLPALFLHRKNILSVGQGRGRWRPTYVLLLGSLAVDRTAGRQVRNGAVAWAMGGLIIEWETGREGERVREKGGEQRQKPCRGGWHQLWEDIEACEKLAKENWAVTCLNQPARRWKARWTRNKRSYSNNYSQCSTGCLLAWWQLPS